MTKDPQEVILCVLEKIKYKADLTPKESPKETKIRKEALKRPMEENEEIVESPERTRQHYFGFRAGKKIKLFRYDLADCSIAFGDDLRNVLGVLKEQKMVMDFRFTGDEPTTEWEYWYEISLPKDFDERFQKFREERKNYAKIRAEEIKNQFEELDERQKAFEELGKQISSRIQKDFDVKQYGEVIKKIDEQAEPIRRALKQLNAVYSGSVQNSLTPVLQRLTESIKPIGEQMKRLKPLFEHPEYPKEAFISSDVIRARQGAETISKLENIEALLQGLLTKNTKKETTVIKKVEIIGRDKIEQHGNKNTAEIKNIAGNHRSKKWFSMDNPIIWFIGTIIVAVVSLILNWLLR